MLLLSVSAMALDSDSQFLLKKQGVPRLSIFLKLKNIWMTWKISISPNKGRPIFEPAFLHFQRGELMNLDKQAAKRPGTRKKHVFSVARGISRFKML